MARTGNRPRRAAGVRRRRRTGSGGAPTAAAGWHKQQTRKRRRTGEEGAARRTTTTPHGTTAQRTTASLAAGTQAEKTKLAEKTTTTAAGPPGRLATTVLDLHGAQLAAWPWDEPPEVLPPDDPSAGRLVLFGRLCGTAVVAKLHDGDRRGYGRERVVASVLDRLLQRGGPPHFVPLLADVPPDRTERVLLGVDGVPAGWDADRCAVLVFGQVPDARPFNDLPGLARRQGVPLRLALLSVLAQLAVAYHALGQLGVTHVDGHFRNVLLEPVADPRAATYGLRCTDPSLRPLRVGTAGGAGPVVVVPVVAARVRLVDWDLAQKVESDADAALRLDASLATTDAHSGGPPSPAFSPVGSATVLRRWNPWEDWARLGLMLRDPAWAFEGAWDVVGPVTGRALFGPYVGAAVPPPPHHLVRQKDRAFHFLCAGRSFSSCTPVLLPGLLRPVQALAVLLAEPELVALVAGLGGDDRTGLPGLPVFSTPACIALDSAPSDAVVPVPSPRGPPASSWLRLLPGTDDWADAVNHHHHLP